MPPPLPRLFLSSTIYDLRDLRNAVQTALSKEGYKVLASEAGTIPIDSSKHSYAICIDAARQCDCLIAIIDGRFGGVMPDRKTSITQAEVEAALDNGRQILFFVRQGVWDAREIYKAYKKAGQPFLPTRLVEDERVFEVIDAIRKRRTGNWIFQFNLPDDLIKTVLFQLEGLEAPRNADLVAWQSKGEAAVETIRLKDMSTPTAKRYSAFLLLDRQHEKTVIHQLVAKVTEQLKTATYQRPGPMRELWAGQPAHVVWTYVGGGLEDIAHGNWLCRTLWVDPKVEEALSIHPLGGDEKVEGIEFIWNPDYEANRQFVNAHRASKGEVMGRVEELSEALLRFAALATDRFTKFNQSGMSEAEFAAVLQAHCDEVRDLYLSCSDVPFGPVDTNEVVDLCGLLGGSVDEMFDSYSIRSMKEENAISRRVRFEVGLSTLQKDLKRWEVALEKVHHG